MLGMRDCGISPTPPLTSRPCIFSAVPFFFLLLLEVSQVHQELVLVSPAQPHQILSVLKVVVTILGISAYYRRKELDRSITATKDLKWYSVATTKDNKNNTMAKTIAKIIQVTFFFTTGITKYMKENLDITKPSYSKHILTVPSLFLYQGSTAQIHGWRHGKLVFFVLFNTARGFENVCEIMWQSRKKFTRSHLQILKMEKWRQKEFLTTWDCPNWKKSSQPLP